MLSVIVVRTVKTECHVLITKFGVIMLSVIMLSVVAL